MGVSIALDNWEFAPVGLVWEATTLCFIGAVDKKILRSEDIGKTSTVSAECIGVLKEFAAGGSERGLPVIDEEFLTWN